MCKHQSNLSAGQYGFTQKIEENGKVQLQKIEIAQTSS